MFKEFRRTDPDMLIINATPGNFSHRRIVRWARKKKKKIIIWTSGHDPGRAKGILRSLKNKLVSTLYKKADYFLTYSTVASRYVESMGVDKSVVRTCYNGIETDELFKNAPGLSIKSKEIKEKYDLGSCITFLYVGGLIPDKKVNLLIDSFIELNKKYEKTKLMIIGDGPLRQSIEEKLKTYNNPDIIYLGRIIQGVDPYFAASDCFVLPGTGGLALNQAMFWRKTCIVSKADGTEEDLVIDNITGYRFKKDDAESLVSAMERRIKESPDKIEAMTENAYLQVITKSNVNNMVKVFSETMNNLLGSKLNPVTEQSAVKTVEKINTDV
jgi:glycosyltransferase involved in cell wall biosynthesis